MRQLPFYLLLGFIGMFGFLTPVQAESFDHDYHETINQTRLHFRVRGTNPRNPYLLILHGGPGYSAHMFYPWGKSVEPFANVVYLDQRGSGESMRLTFQNPLQPTPAEVKNYTIANLLRDIEGVRAFLKVKRWYVLGHSWGGMLGLEYVTAYPDKVLGYLHVDGLLSQPKAQEDILLFAERQIARDEKSKDAVAQERAKRLKPYIQYARNLPAGNNRMFSTMQFAFALFEPLYYANGAVGQAYNVKIKNALAVYKLPTTATSPANEPAVALLQTEHYATRDETPLLTKVRCPTLVINGKQDGIIPPQTAILVQKGIPNARLLILDKCGHFPFAEQPEDFTKAIQEFMKR